MSTHGFTVHEYQGDLRETERILRIMEAVGWGKTLGTPAEWAARFERKRAESGRRMFVAKKGFLVVGFVELLTKPARGWRVGEHTAYVYQMAVDPRHTRSGAARDLAVEVMVLLYEMGYAAIAADIRWDNIASLTLAQSVGLSLVGPSPEPIAENAGGAPHLRLQCMLTARPTALFA
jgi:ribosomal protein S18 acetylase RimI-like enzyme